MKQTPRQQIGGDEAAKLPAELRAILASVAAKHNVGKRDVGKHASATDEQDAVIAAEAELFDRVRTYRPGAVPFVDLSSPGSSGWGALVLAFVLAAVVGGVGFFAIRGVMSQFAVRDWKPVQAQIDASRVEVTQSTGRRGRKRTHHEFKVSYSYEVDGQRFASQMVDAAGDPFRSYGYAQARLNEYPGGKAVTAYFNPQNPREAVLKTDLLAYHGILLIFVIPMIPWIIKLGVDWYQSAIARQWTQAAAGLPIGDDGTNISITLPRHGVLNYTMYVWFGLLLAVTIYFLIWGVITSSEASFALMAGLYVATIPLALIAAASKLSSIRSGSKDLAINRITREVMLPATFGRSIGTIIELDCVDVIQTTDVMSRTKHGKEFRSATKLSLVEGGREHDLAVWSDARRADGLGEYLAGVMSEVKAGTGMGPSGRRIMQPRGII